MGVVILAILYVLNAIVVFAFVGLLMMWGALAAGALGLICTAPFMLFGVFFLLVAFGLYNMKTWAWMVALIFAILGLLGAIGNLATFSTIGDAGDVPGAFIAVPAINLIINLVILVYLFKVKSYFR